MDAFWRIDPRPDGGPAPSGPTAETLEDKLELVAGGDALTMAPAGSAHASRSDLTFVPVDGVEPCAVVVAARADDARPVVKRFRSAAAALLRPA